jgi:hypothetical protein
MSVMPGRVGTRAPGTTSASVSKSVTAATKVPGASGGVTPIRASLAERVVAPDWLVTDGRSVAGTGAGGIAVKPAESRRPRMSGVAAVSVGGGAGVAATG